MYADSFEEMNADKEVKVGGSAMWADGDYQTKVDYLEFDSIEEARAAYEQQGFAPAQADRILTPLKQPENWTATLPEGAKVASFPINAGLLRWFLVVSASDGGHYDTVSIYANKKAISLWALLHWGVDGAILFMMYIMLAVRRKE